MLILTAIVVNVSTTAVALALVVRIKEAYGSIEQDDIAHIRGKVMTTRSQAMRTVRTFTTRVVARGTRGTGVRDI